MAARGIWIEMLCLMHEAEPRGHLLLNGRPVTDAQLAALAGVPADIAQALLGELEAAGTFSRTRAGVIYSRKMRRDTATSAKQRANVEKRWSKATPSAPKQAPKNKRENAARITEADTDGIPKKPEARSQIEDANASKAPISLTDVAEAIYFLQPEGYRRSTRPDILDALQVQVKDGSTPAAIFGSVKAYYALPDCKRDAGQFAKAAHRIIQRGRWKDYAPAPKKLTPTTPEDEARRLRHYRDTGEWRATWGPKPEPERKSA
jgi:hypothetical protein